MVQHSTISRACAMLYVGNRGDIIDIEVQDIVSKVLDSSELRSRSLSFLRKVHPVSRFPDQAIIVVLQKEISKVTKPKLSRVWHKCTVLFMILLRCAG
jgi:hypothetical protein